MILTGRKTKPILSLLPLNCPYFPLRSRLQESGRQCRRSSGRRKMNPERLPTSGAGESHRAADRYELPRAGPIGTRKKLTRSRVIRRRACGPRTLGAFPRQSRPGEERIREESAPNNGKPYEQWPSSWALRQPNSPRSDNRARIRRWAPKGFCARGSYPCTNWRSKARLRAGNARRGAATNPTTDA